MSKRSSLLTLTLVVATLAALFVGGIEVWLIERRIGLFTGGFLSVWHLDGPGAMLAFALASFLGDLALTFPIAGLALWSFARGGSHALPALLAAFAAAVFPILVWDWFLYEIGAYFGDAFDLSLLFEIAARDPAEILAVAWPHAARLLGLGVLLGASLAGGLWVVWRRGPRSGRLPDPPAPARMLGIGVLVMTVGVATLTVARISGADLDYGLKRKPSGILFGVAGEWATDFDSDGYGLLARPADPDPFDARVKPWRPDRPGNGLDEDGVGGDLPAERSAWTESSDEAPRFAAHPNLIFVLLESVRADVLNAELDGRAVTPVLNALARAGIAAPAVYSHNGYTTTSRRDLFRGTLINRRGHRSLVDDFLANGYEVAYFSAQDESFGGPAFDVGMGRAQVRYDARSEPERRFTASTTPGSIGLPWQVMVERVTEFLARRTDPRPLFLFVNLQDTHFPYHHAGIEPVFDDAALPRVGIAPENAAALRRTYLNTMANVDGAIGKIVGAAREHLHDPSPAVIVTSDHGESLFDGGLLGHGTALRDEQFRVPFVAAHLPLVIPQPMGLAGLRDLVWASLSVPWPPDPRPVLREDPGGRVFVYLGTLRRPRQIGWRTEDAFFIFDFRTRRVRLPDANVWLAPEALDGEARETFLDLIRHWEAMVLAMEGIEPEGDSGSNGLDR